MKKEIVELFQNETLGLVRDLEASAARMKECGIMEFPESELRDFAQKIDRVMGAAKSLEDSVPGKAGLKLIGEMSETCKTVGYQAAALKRASLAPFFADFCIEALSVIARLVATLHDEGASRTIVDGTAKLQGRMKWLREMAAPTDDEERAKVSELLKRL